MKEEKSKFTAGADSRTPSVPQYFSWINNTWEGSTEEQTLTNLRYFDFLLREYGMRLEVYAWDAGNLDGAGHYQPERADFLAARFPNGYKPLADAADKIGCRLGMWCGPDGFGDTDESAAGRTETMVSLCRDLNFRLFKIDGCCGQLSEKNRPYFVNMMKECRRYSPDLILLNHRLYLGEEGMKYATTSLWNGVETYTDVHIMNGCTAPHHRAYALDRGNTPGLERLMEDHGVCLSSCLDFFEDELVFQSFGRCLILAPEIYANPWLLRDDEQAHLARIYNLHRRHRDILVNGMLLPEGEHYPKNTVARGSVSRRFITAGNMSWTARTLRMRLDLELGLAPCDRVTVSVHHPYEKYIGEFNYGDVVDVDIMPFRACLVEVCDSREADVMLTGCEYEVLHEDEDGRVDRVKIVSSGGEISWSDGKPFDKAIDKFDSTLRAPIKLGEIAADVFAPVPENSEAQLEVTQFAQDHDSLESRSLRRSGETAILEVKAARDAFFSQKSYVFRGTESSYAFDGDENTCFDGESRVNSLRMDGGCLRVDFGAEFEADFLRLEYFDIDEPMPRHAKKQLIPPMCDFSTDLSDWRESTLEKVNTVRRECAEILLNGTNRTAEVEGRRREVLYPINGRIRYVRMPSPLDRIYKIALVRDGQEIKLTSPRANNLMPYKREVKYIKEMKITVNQDDWREDCYISVGLEGEHGLEGAYALIEVDGKCIGAEDRAPSYPSNVWEHRVRGADKYYTYYFPIKKEMQGKELTIRVLGLDETKKDYPVTAYLCDKNKEIKGIVCNIR